MKKNCQLLSCRQKQTVDWNIIDRKKGELQVQFQALPKYCNFETYVIELEIYDETMPYDEGLMCNTGNTSWKTHSRRIFDNRFCSTGESFPEDCLQVRTWEKNELLLLLLLLIERYKLHSENDKNERKPKGKESTL